jgi:hypothetical protein
MALTAPHPARIARIRPLSHSGRGVAEGRGEGDSLETQAFVLLTSGPHPALRRHPLPLRQERADGEAIVNP